MDAINSLDPREPQPGVPLDPERKAIADRITAEILDDLGGKPAFGDYRRVYDTLGFGRVLSSRPQWACDAPGTTAGADHPAWGTTTWSPSRSPESTWASCSPTAPI